MDDFLSDEERAERFKKWWVDNWKSIAAGVIIALIIIFGWRYWQHRTASRGLAASTMYNQMGQLLAAGQGAAGLKLANQLVNNYRDTPYASQAALAMAQYDIGTSKPDDAMQMLDWVIKNSKDGGLQLLARLRMARVKLTVGDPQAALVALADVQPGGFAPLFEDARGDAYAKLGETGKACMAYQAAVKAWTPEMGDDSLLRMKLENLAGCALPAVATKAAPVIATAALPAAATQSGVPQP